MPITLAQLQELRRHGGPLTITIWDEDTGEIVSRETISLPPEEPAGRGGRPKGRRTIPPLAVGDGPLHALNGLTAQLYMNAIQAGGARDGWTGNGEGHPEYREEGKKMAGVVTYEALDTALDAAFRDVWGDVAELGAGDLQLFMCVSNALLLHPNPPAGILIDARRYAEARGVTPKEDAEDRQAFNDSVRRICSLSMRADVMVTVRRGKKETRSVRGRMVMPEVVATTETGWVADPKRQPITREVTGWRLIPGTAWLACRDMNHIGRFPRALLEMNPRRDDFLIRLGAFLGHQTAIRAAVGTLAQPLSVRAILAGIHESVPDDRRRVKDLRDRLDTAMDELQSRGVLASWEWVDGTPAPARLVDAMVRFLYQRECLDDYTTFYPKAKWAMRQPEVQTLLPDAPPRKNVRRGQK